MSTKTTTEEATRRISPNLFSRLHLFQRNPSDLVAQIMVHSGMLLRSNTLFLEYNQSLDHLDILRIALKLRRHCILYRQEESAAEAKSSIDVWWQSEVNGNFMLILAYIINQNRRLSGEETLPLRLFHYLGKDEIQDSLALEEHLSKSRLSGEVHILPFVEGKALIEVMSEYSQSSSYVFAGLPGEQADERSSRWFHLDHLLFERMIKNFSPEVSIFFVKCFETFQLISE